MSSVRRALALGRPWAFSDRHAEMEYALHFDDLAELSEVRWDVMPLRHWPTVGEERQAEFLVRDFFPWEAVTGVAARSPAVAARAKQAIRAATHRTPVAVRPGWYY